MNELSNLRDRSSIDSLLLKEIVINLFNGCILPRELYANAIDQALSQC